MLALAGKRSPDTRHALLRAVADSFFFDTPHRATTEFDLYDEIMVLVLAEVEPAARKELAERLADLPGPPRRALLRLAEDVIDVARPVLMRSPALHDDDLEPIARAQTQDHLLAIALRKVLSERLTDILVSRGNDYVASTLGANTGARISDSGFSGLAIRAASSDIVLNSLMMRRDLPEQLAGELLPMLQESLQSRIVDLKADSSAQADQDLVAGEARLTDDVTAAAAPARPLAMLIRYVERGDLSFGDAAIELADADRLIDLAALLGMRIDLPSETIVRNLFGSGRARMMLICRAAGLDANAFSAVLRLINRRKPEACAEPARLLRGYLRVSRDNAMDIISAMRARPDPSVTQHTTRC